jgi:F-type H+-transporting ATPase subunit b
MENLVKLGLNPAWLVAQIVNFILLLIILRAVAYKPILNMLDARKKKIQESLEYAEKVKHDAEDQQKEFDRKLAQARQETQAAAAAAAQVGAKERERIVAEAHEEARKVVEQAREQIEYERKQMLNQVREQVVQLSLLATQKVVSKSLDESAHRKLVDDFISQTGDLN